MWAWRRGVARRETRVSHAFRCGRGSRLAAGVRGDPLCVCATQPGVGCGVFVCSSWGPGKGRARHATLHRQAADHRMRSAAPVCVCVRAVDEAGGGGACAFGDARRSASLYGWRFLQPRGQPRGRFSVDWPVREGAALHGRGGVAQDRFFFGGHPPSVARHIPHIAPTSPPRSALVAPRARWCASVSGGRSVVQQRGRERSGPRRIRSRRATSSTTHAVQRPPVGGQAPSFHTVRRTCWCSSTRHHHRGGGPA